MLSRAATRTVFAAARRVHTEARIAKLGYTLPQLLQPVGAYTLGVKQVETHARAAAPCTRAA